VLLAQLPALPQQQQRLRRPQRLLRPPLGRQRLPAADGLGRRPARVAPRTVPQPLAAQRERVRVLAVPVAVLVVPVAVLVLALAPVRAPGPRLQPPPRSERCHYGTREMTCSSAG
jgi:hypothetical protein